MLLCCAQNSASLCGIFPLSRAETHPGRCVSWQLRSCCQVTRYKGIKAVCLSLSHFPAGGYLGVFQFEKTPTKLPHTLRTFFFCEIYLFLILCPHALPVCTPRVCGACGGQKEVVDSLEPELETVTRCRVDAGNHTRVLSKRSKCS